ncbi:MAG: response regulator [Bacteroidota bacterium]
MKKILILEDDQVNQELLKLYLNDTFDTELVSSISEALALLNKNTYDIIISDIHISDDSNKDGVDFLKAVRANTKTANIPILAYTAFNDPNDINEIQFTGVISKPITKQDFLKRVNSYLVKS